MRILKGTISISDKVEKKIGCIREMEDRSYCPPRNVLSAVYPNIILQALGHEVWLHFERDPLLIVSWVSGITVSQRFIVCSFALFTSKMFLLQILIFQGCKCSLGSESQDELFQGHPSRVIKCLLEVTHG